MYTDTNVALRPIFALEIRRDVMHAPDCQVLPFQLTVALSPVVLA
jgi:hypothetical protein